MLAFMLLEGRVTHRRVFCFFIFVPADPKATKACVGRVRRCELLYHRGLKPGQPVQFSWCSTF